MLNVKKEFVESKAVIMKPNLIYPVYKKGVTTGVEFVEGLVAALRKIDTTTKIYIG